MPYICLTSALSDGQVQILDLVPNSSQQRPGHDSPGQTRYLNRVQNDTAAVQYASGTLIEDHASGLRAYLLDKVEPAGLDAAVGVVTFTGALAGETVTIGGLLFTAMNGGAVPAAQQFNMNAGDNATAASFVTTLNDAASVAAMAALNTNVYAWSAGAVGNAVGMSSRLSPGATAVVGPNGSLTMASTNAVREALTSAIVGVTTRFSRTNEHWNTCLTATAAALIARVDAGLVMALADVNTVLATQASANLTSVGSNSVGVLTELLSILAGRGYRVNRLSRAGAIQQFFSAVNPTYQWNPVLLGGFTYPVTTFSGWDHGECVPGSIGGDTANIEWKNIRHTYDGGSFTISVMAGALATMRRLAGQPAITLYPDSDLCPHYPWTYQGALTFPAQTNVRLVTVYNDDGSLAG